MTIEPTRPEDRIEALDLLRGFAIFGILVVNMTVFSGSAWSADTFTGRVDRLAYHAIDILAQGKFLNLFSFLFGVGFSLQLRRAAGRPGSFTAVYSRRLIGLLIIGVFHGVFIAWVDVLQAYALLGLLLLFVSRLSERRVLVLAALCLVLPVVVNGWVLPALQPVPVSDPFGQWQAAHGTVGYAGLVALRVDFWLWIYTSPDWYADVLGTEFLLFLLGLFAGSVRFFERLDSFILSMKRALPWLVVAGAAMTISSVYVPGDISGLAPVLSSTLRDRVFLLGAITLSAAYASGLILVSTLPAWGEMLAPLRHAGRMALTNYLMQSVICALLFYRPGFALYGRVGPALGLLITIGILALQLGVSTAWLRVARFGPVEWLWRCSTYGRWFPIVRATRAAEAQR